MTKVSYFSVLKRIIIFSFLVFSVSIILSDEVLAMHISEGVLPPFWCFSWGAISFPFLILGFLSIKKKVNISPKLLVLLSLCGAFAFVLSSLKLPSVSGSSSHPTGVGFGSILFGPFAMSIISMIVLLFQAILLAHGGITTLGANIFSMGIVGPIITFVIYKAIKKAKANTNIAIFLAVIVGEMATYITTALQLAIAFPDNGSFLTSAIKFISVFAITQIPIAISEGILTVIIFGVIEKYSYKELEELKVI